jgi:S-adenosyl-L-methionine hydrolase (adenosine-forming)
VGTMKGVILSRCPAAQIIDISHGIAKFSILAGAYAIVQAAPYFPAGAVHVVVIDPGVGTERKALVVEACGQLFVGPDNGVFSFVFARDPNAFAREISNPALRLPEQSSTFHGRDIFAPAAAFLAAGNALVADAGQAVHSPVLLPNLAPQQIAENAWNGLVVSVDHFGNVITNFPAAQFGTALHNAFHLALGSGKVTSARRSFGDAPQALLFAYIGSSGFIEVGANQSDAGRELGVRPGDGVRLVTGI